ncbi:MAG: hypothetical protein R2715_21830 [Ilumatobacteraceae bacterium]
MIHGGFVDIFPVTDEGRAFAVVFDLATIPPAGAIEIASGAPSSMALWRQGG